MEYSKRGYDGKIVEWVWMSDAALGFIKYSDVRRFPHLAENGRGVITKIFNDDELINAR